MTLKPSVRRPLFSALHLVTLGVAAVAAATFAFAPKSRADLPVYGQIPDFALTGHDGGPLTTSSLEGKPWIGDFIFTGCQGQCLVMNEQVAGLRDELSGVRFVSFTADPERDTPEVLARYAGKYGADVARWTFATGPRGELDRVSAALKFGRLGDPLFHSTRLVLVDAAGRVRGYYDSNEPSEIDRLKSHARSLASS